MPSPLTILIGTTKGAFLLFNDDTQWKANGPYCDGWGINHVIADPQSGVIYAAGGGDFHGAGVFRSSDKGNSWTLSKLSTGTMDEWCANDPDAAAMFNWTPPNAPFGDELKSIWSLHLSHGQLHAGADPGQLLSSSDGGQSWERNEAFANFEGREDWSPGAAGLILHSIVSDPSIPGKLWLGVSAVGVFASEDGGTSWERRNRLSNVSACNHSHHPAAPSGGETGHCVHNIARGPGDLLYQQNHHGVFRSPDGGRNWEDITDGLPSTFGFPIAIDPDDDQTIWTFPLNGDTQGRFPPDAAAAVWRSTDGGGSWNAQRTGLPQAAWFTVLRQSMASAPGHVAFGTNSGSVFLSRDRGETWDEIATHLPTILSVEMAEL